jgi:hypothetical protein
MKREKDFFAMTLRHANKAVRQVNRRATNLLYRRAKIRTMAAGIRSSIG